MSYIPSGTRFLAGNVEHAASPPSGHARGTPREQQLRMVRKQIKIGSSRRSFVGAAIWASLAGCAMESPSESRDDDLLTRTIVRIDADGGTVVSQEQITRAAQQEALARREQGVAKRGAPAISQDGGCVNSSLWMFDEPGLAGNEICFTGTGLAHLEDYRWNARVRSYWAGDEGGALAVTRGAPTYECQDRFGVFLRAVAVETCAASANTLVLGTPDSSALRFATFNTAFVASAVVPNPRSCDDCDDEVCRAAKMADRILAAPYDVVALNEVFDEDARAALVARLAPAFPYRVEKVEDDHGHDDSGLMLFSKHPFIAPERTGCLADSASGYLVAVNGAAGAWDQVGFVGFGDTCGDADCLASKGAAYVRIQDERSGQTHSIVFSHIQASYSADDYDSRRGKKAIRADQLRRIEHLVGCMTTPEQLQHEPLFVMGDLNIDGDLAVPNYGDDPEHTYHNRWEYDDTLAPSGTGPLPLFHDVVRDQWAATTSPADRGLSLDHDERLDYVMMSNPPHANVNLCMQHMSLGYNLMASGPEYPTALGTGGTCPLSDHMAVNAELAEWAPHCSPAEAVVAPPRDVWNSHEITHPGNVQWFYVADPGTYSIAVSHRDVAFRVFDATDLSRPIDPYHGEHTTNANRQTFYKYVPHGPFYVEVYSPHPTWTGPYQVLFHKHDCTSEAEACVLLADEPYYEEMTAPAYEDGAAWFQVDIDIADSRKPQALSFVVDHYYRPGLQIELRHPGVPTPVAPPAVGYYRPDVGWLEAKIERNDGVLDEQKLLLVVTRTDLAPIDYQLTWHTNLTILHGISAGVPDAWPLTLKCLSQQEMVEDEIWLEWTIDGVIRGGWDGRNYDDDEVKSFEPAFGTVKFVEGVTFRVTEIDDTFNESAESTIETLDKVSPGSSRVLGKEASFDLNPGKSGGMYYLRYNLSRSVGR